MNIKEVSATKSFDGWHKQFVHQSGVLNCTMKFSVYLPPQANGFTKVPVLYWLSGLTCSDENFMHKAGAHRIASQLGIAIVVPDTSPRGSDIPDDESYDLGQGAGFYVNATQMPWSKHFQMYDYVVYELPALVEAMLPVSGVRAIAGHSMGGHGALIVALRNPSLYRSVSAFSPINNPINCPWGQKAFISYLGEDKASWLKYDASELIKLAKVHIPLLVSQGEADEFLEHQLRPEALKAAARLNQYPMQFNTHEDYDHSYYFVASFIEQHMKFHAEHLIK